VQTQTSEIESVGRSTLFLRMALALAWRLRISNPDTSK
jgi:hypothetical protein